MAGADVELFRKSPIERVFFSNRHDGGAERAEEGRIVGGSTAADVGQVGRGSVTREWVRSHRGTLT